MNTNTNTNTLDSLVESGINSSKGEAFFVFNVEDIIEKHKKWLRLLPRVVPHYAVKCNNLPLVLEILSALGLSFDCSSRVCIIVTIIVILIIVLIN